MELHSRNITIPSVPFILFTLILSVSLSVPSFTHATRWPFIITPNTTKPVFVSKNKYIVLSRVKIKKLISSERTRALFSDVSSLTMNFEQNSLEDVFHDARKKRTTNVYVLLAKSQDIHVTEWRFKSPKGFIIEPEDYGKKRKSIKVSAITIKVKDGLLWYGGKPITKRFRLRPIAGHGSYNGIIYDGDFIIMPYNNSFLCINCVELEDYITSVLRTESWPGWPLEINKAFAIACRSYVMFKVLEARRTGRPYHVKNTNAHQTYHGKHELPSLKMAVEQTRGVVLGFKGSPILAMFDCCCGGVIPAHIEDFDFNKVPYLARAYACQYCKESSLYSWQVSYDHALFEPILRDYLKDIIRLSDIRIIKKDKAGLASQVRLKGPKHTIVISGKKLYSLLKEVKSFHFDVCKKGGKIVFTGNGFGHHIGLCQWGARQMVREGWDYKSILQFYYPDTYFMHLI